MKRLFQRLAFLAVTSLGAADQVHALVLPEPFLDKVRSAYGLPAESRLRAWMELVETNVSASDAEKLDRVNEFFNQMHFSSDADNWKKPDYWATPMEFIIRDAGDGEDFAIAKYFTLLDLGVNASRLRITYVTTSRLKSTHVVLAYYATSKSEPLILDNFETRVLPAKQRKDLRPVYSFHAQDVRRLQLEDGGDVSTFSSPVRQWENLVARMEKTLQ